MVETDHSLPGKQNTSVPWIPITYTARKIATHYRNPVAWGWVENWGSKRALYRRAFPRVEYMGCEREKDFIFSKLNVFAVGSIIDVFRTRILNTRSVRFVHFISISSGILENRRNVHGWGSVFFWIISFVLKEFSLRSQKKMLFCVAI